MHLAPPPALATLPTTTVGATGGHGSEDREAERGTRGPGRSTLNRVLTAIVLVAMAVAAYRMRGTLADAVSSLAALDATAIGAVLGCYGLIVVTRGLLQRWSIPGANLRQGVLLDQVNLAVSNSVPGGAVVGAAVRYRIGRSLGHAPEAMAVSVIAVGQAVSVGRWLLVAAVLVGAVLAGTASGFDVALLGSAVVAVAASGALWWIVVHDTRATRRLVASAQALVDRAGRRVPSLRGRAVAPFVSGLRDRAGDLGRARAGRILAAGAAISLGGATIVALVVGALGGAGAPGYLDVVRVYLLVRVAAGLSPTPGNVGVVEGALVAGLVAAGTDPAAAVAAVMVYRGLTYALPIATGSALYLGWRRWDRRTHPATVEPSPTVTAPVIEPAASGSGRVRPVFDVVVPVVLGQTAAHATSAGGG